MFEIAFLKEAWDEYMYWQGHDPRQVKKINRLIQECVRTPYEGIGKPEPLKWQLRGCWSRRIDDEHRLVYRVQDDKVVIISCRSHYKN
ncbi:toxin YoeB [Caedimonas varicaedens]|jgi:toxin YoeB|uniref:Putative mRNA interferase YoeB n=1 Tax=Caedimonas varicaedens TaxID=1629334 RepID=A0A0K8MC90_9PROT|nr:toxin YoeB [Caedimonas varicaedens]